MTVTHHRFSEYSGPRILGTTPYSIQNSTDFWTNAGWLTSAVESGAKFGAITMYDGTGCTAGLHQAVAVYPKELSSEDFAAADDQGSLFALLESLDRKDTQNILEEFHKQGWTLKNGFLTYQSNGVRTVSGRTIHTKAGDLVFGVDIRNELTPLGGKVPSSGPQWEKSKSWALRFHEAFASPLSFSAQINFGKNHLISSTKRRKLRVNKVMSSAWDLVFSTSSTYTSPLSLCLSVLLSHSVNAPSAAFAILETAINTHSLEDDENFSRFLMRSLGTSTYGRWNFSLASGRYQRTRQHAMKLWPASLFDLSGIMPEKL